MLNLPTRFILKCLWMVGLLLSLIITGCSTDEPNNRNLPGAKAKQIDGTVMMPDGITPVANALVYVQSNSVTPTRSTKITPHAHSTDCSNLLSTNIDNACTDADGSFSIKLTDTSITQVNLIAEKGVFSKAVSLDLNTLALPVDPNLGGANLAVVTGQYDRLQDILAKLGYGTLDPATFQLLLGTETFTLYDGDNSLDDMNYQNGDALFLDNDGSGQPDIFDYDIVFFNCTSIDDYYYLLTAPSTITTLRNYVTGGGNLYFTDLTYNLIEASFPEVLDFFGNTATAETEVESTDSATVGLAEITVNATIANPLLQSWLNTVTCTPSPCINTDQTIPITGFLRGWIVLDGLHPSALNANSTWARGAVRWTNLVGQQFSGDKPLTITFDVGLGTVLFSSYHVDPITNAAPTFTSQERVLQYLIFEM